MYNRKIEEEDGDFALGAIVGIFISIPLWAAIYFAFVGLKVTIGYISTHF